MNYYIQGSAAKAEEIREAFEKLGYDTSGHLFNAESVLYFTLNGDIRATTCNCTPAIIKTHPNYKELELPIEPCFKVGDKIEATIYGIKRRVTIRQVDRTNRCYFGTLEECIGFSEQDQWNLATKTHYDIKNFHAGMPVLVRDANDKEWRYVLYSHETERYGLMRFNAGATIWNQCIPFNDDTKHLLGTTDMCDEMYINW